MQSLISRRDTKGWWGFICRNYVVWPTFLLMNVFITLKGSHFWFLFQYWLALTCIESETRYGANFDNLFLFLFTQYFKRVTQLADTLFYLVALYNKAIHIYTAQKQH